MKRGIMVIMNQAMIDDLLNELTHCGEGRPSQLLARCILGGFVRDAHNVQVLRHHESEDKTPVQPPSILDHLRDHPN